MDELDADQHATASTNEKSNSTVEEELTLLIIQKFTTECGLRASEIKHLDVTDVPDQ
jgi:hypothetical protein